MPTNDGATSGGSFDFEGRRIQAQTGDTVASALYRAGVRTFSRSFKFRRKRGLYCLTGDCPNCLLTIDDEPAVRSCRTAAHRVRRVSRGSGWPSADFDVFGVLWHFRALLPVGFYYKSLMRPRALWPIAERVLRLVAGLGPVSPGLVPTQREQMNHHPTLLVVGGGEAGLSAALAGAHDGERVLLADEGIIGEAAPAGLVRARIASLRTQLERHPRVTILERATAVGIYEGPLVPIVGEHYLHIVHPRRIVVATGATERHGVFPGNDLRGVWLGRGAARLAGVHALSPGRRIVIVAKTTEALEHLRILHALSDTAIVAVVAPSDLAAGVPAGIEIIDGEVVEARGRTSVRAVVVRTASGRRTIACDALVLSLGLEPRDSLFRQAAISGLRSRAAVTVVGDAATETALPPEPRAGFVCLCEDVTAGEIEQAWDEGYRSTELLKRYSTSTMGACQGTLCHAHLRGFVCARNGDARQGKPTVARPPARPVRLEDIAAGVRVPVEYHTALHERHLACGAAMEWAGMWKRPSNYGDVEQEYWAVRTGVSIMDVSTLGKYRVAGPDATRLLERLYPCRVSDLKAWRSRYTLLLNEAGYLFDDGMVCSLGDGSYYVTFTSGGGDAAESWLREWADEWGLKVHIVNHTVSRAAINVAGPRARELLARLTHDAIDPQSLPYGGLAEITVDGVPCLAIRVGFVGELSIELHHPARQSPALWDALLDAGVSLGIRPHGLDALKLLRLEKGHLIIGVDTDFDTTPAKVGLDWAVKMDKADFIGRTALQRLARLPRERTLLPMSFDGKRAPEEGAQLLVEGVHVGNITSSRFSPALSKSVALGWVRHPEGVPPSRLVARDTVGDLTGFAAKAPFYDPKGERLRG